MKKENKMHILLNNLFWGLVLWIFGYVLGIMFFAFVPKDMLGWAILPFGVALMLWVLLKKIKREQFMCYIGLGVIWTVMALVLDYAFVVKLFGATDYYKPDVYVYYVLTLVLPIAVGIYRFKEALFGGSKKKR